MFNKWLLSATPFLLMTVHLLIREVQGDKLPDGYIPCDQGWFNFGGKCYKTFGTNEGKLNWHDASNRCKSLGGHLATIQSKEVQEFLFVSQIPEDNIRAWIGLNDLQNETHYKWDDGTEFKYSNWNTNEPTEMSDKDSDEDCVEMLFRVCVGHPGEWNDNKCASEFPYICQVDEGKQGKVSRDPTLCSSGKGRGWKFGNSCYNIVKERMTWDDAEKYCQDKFSGHLLKIVNFMVDYILQYIMSDFRNDIWIGVKMKNQFQQQFSSGWYAAYTNWLGSSQPDFVTDTCVIRREETFWEAVSCKEKYPFICEVSTASPPVLKKPPEGSKCPETAKDWRDLGGELCYFIDTKNKFNWYRANFECNARGGSLVSFHSKAELDALAPFVKYKKDECPIRPMYIGLLRTQDDENAFAWQDGSAVSFTNWDKDEPNNKDEKCGEMWVPTMKWNDVNCDNTRGYICSIKKISPTTVKSETVSEYIRPSKYCLNPGKVENGRVTYLPGIIGRRTPQDNPEDPEYPEGARLQYVCNSRYILNGLSILTCEKSGEWSSKRPTCISEDDIFDCDKPKSFPNRIMTYYPPGSASSADIRNIQKFPPGSRLEYSCAEGYRLEGSSSRECASIGMWRPSAPICEIDCGISSKQSDPKITNGNKTEVGEWPWIVGIAVKEGNANRIICGGALITSKAILTAAHCLTDRNSLILYFGKYHRYDRNDDTEVERRQSENIIIHQDYNRDTMNSDIALVTFSPPIRFTKRIKPICLPINAWKTAENLEPTKSGYVTGWGLTERKLPSDELLLAHLPVVTNEACINGYERNGLEISITTNMYCAGFAEGGQNVCKGDSGSPMVFYDEYKEKYTIEGLVSFSLRGQCGQPERYSIFTKVFQFVPWILSKTNIN